MAEPKQKYSQFKGQPRLPKFAVPKRYDLKLKPDLTACKFSGAVQISIDIVTETKFLVLNAAELSVNPNSVTFTSENKVPFALIKATSPYLLRLVFDDLLLACLCSLHRAESCKSKFTANFIYRRMLLTLIVLHPTWVWINLVLDSPDNIWLQWFSFMILVKLLFSFICDPFGSKIE